MQATENGTAQREQQHNGSCLAPGILGFEHIPDDQCDSVDFGQVLRGVYNPFIVLQHMSSKGHVTPV